MLISPLPGPEQIASQSTESLLSGRRIVQSQSFLGSSTALRPSERRHCEMARRAAILAVAAPEASSSSTHLRIHNYGSMSQEDIKSCISRPRVDFHSILQTVEPIVNSVRDDGDAAVLQWTSRFDKVDVDCVCCPINELPEPQLDPEISRAFDVAYNNIKAFHAAQQSTRIEVETMPGVWCSREARPIDSVGLYVPGGTAVLPSSTLMLAVPAGLAGCRTIVMATPPRSDGSITPEVLYCARKAGVTHVLKAGGAQAVAAMAWGTETCPKVHKILGPGNQYVTAAKMMLQNSEAMVAMDMPAGPSEVLVIADAAACPRHVAADLLSQAEHGPDSQVILVALPGLAPDSIEAELDRQITELPRLKAVQSAFTHSAIVRAKSRQEAVEFSNAYAPEHLIINTADAKDWVRDIANAGSIFLGPWAPVTVGDYASGTNHTLPTYGYAQMYSGVSLDSFQKHMTVQYLSHEGLRNIGPAVSQMAAVEGLEAHRKSITVRLE